MSALHPRVSFAELCRWPDDGRQPDLAVEVVSPSTERRDRGRKMDLLARSGVPEYWIVDPVANVLEIYQLQAQRYFLAAVCAENDHVESPTLAGLSFAARRLFEE